MAKRCLDMHVKGAKAYFQFCLPPPLLLPLPFTKFVLCFREIGAEKPEAGKIQPSTTTPINCLSPKRDTIAQVSKVGLTGLLATKPTPGVVA